MMATYIFSYFYSALFLLSGGHIAQRLKRPLHNDQDVGSNPAAA